MNTDVDKMNWAQKSIYLATMKTIEAAEASVKVA